MIEKETDLKENLKALAKSQVYLRNIIGQYEYLLIVILPNTILKI